MLSEYWFIEPSTKVHIISIPDGCTEEIEFFRDSHVSKSILPIISGEDSDCGCTQKWIFGTVITRNLVIPSIRECREATKLFKKY